MEPWLRYYMGNQRDRRRYIGMRNVVRSPIVWIGAAVSAGALYLAFRGLRWSDIGEALGEANYGLLLLAMALLLLSLWARAQRWAALFQPHTGLRQSNLIGTMNAGYAISNLLPLRIGELARAYLIGEVEDVTAPRALSTIIVERTLDTLTVVALLLITLPFIDAPDWAKGPALLLGVGFLGLAVLLAFLSAARERTMALVSWSARLLPSRLRQRAERAAGGVIEGFAVLRQPRTLAQAVGWSLVSWLLSAAFTSVVLRAFGLDFGVTGGLFLTAALALGMVIPSSPGYIGVFHAIAIESLVNVFDADRNQAASYALVQHAISYMIPLAIGAAFLWRKRDIWQRVRLWDLDRERLEPSADISRATD